MTLLSPWWLLLLVPVAMLAVAYLVQHRRRSRYAVRFASLPCSRGWHPAGPAGAGTRPAASMLCAFALLGLAAARPEMEVRVPRENATVVVAVDVSNSMQATDVEPSRVEAASAAAIRFVEDLPDGFNVGIVTFSGRTTVLATPSTDRETAIAASTVSQLEGRTAIGEGVFTSLDAIRTQARLSGEAKVPAHVVLLSDGTNTAGRTPEEAAAAARAAGVPVSTIAYGTPDGVIEIQGQVIGVPVDEESLAELAEATDGRAYTAQSSDELNEVYDDIQSSIGWRMEPRDVTQYVSAIALVFGLIAAAMSLRWFARLP